MIKALGGAADTLKSPVARRRRFAAGCIRLHPDQILFTPGIKSILFDWRLDDGALPLSFNDQRQGYFGSELAAAAEVEFREVANANDPLDRMVHLAGIAYSEGRFADALARADDVLREHAASVKGKMIRVYSEPHLGALCDGEGRAEAIGRGGRARR
jgi:hypothetical protein